MVCGTHFEKDAQIASLDPSDPVILGSQESRMWWLVGNRSDLLRTNPVWHCLPSPLLALYSGCLSFFPWRRIFSQLSVSLLLCSSQAQHPAFSIPIGKVVIWSSGRLLFDWSRWFECCQLLREAFCCWRMYFWVGNCLCRVNLVFNKDFKDLFHLLKLISVNFVQGRLAAWNMPPPWMSLGIECTDLCEGAFRSPQVTLSQKQG